MLSIIKRWLGIAALEAEVGRLKQGIMALSKGEAVVLPDGKTVLPPLPKVKMRNRSWAAFSRRREGEAWRDMVHEAYPDDQKRAG